MSIYVDAIFGLISLLLLIFGFWFLYRDFMLDRTRQKLFKLRDDWFDEAARNEISFDNKAYKTVRLVINGSIRFAHKLTFLQLLVLHFAPHQSNSEGVFRTRINEGKSALPTEKRKLVDNYIRRYHFILSCHLVFSSPIAVITVILPAILIFLNIKMANALRTYVARKAANLVGAIFSQTDEYTYSAQYLEQ